MQKSILDLDQESLFQALMKMKKNNILGCINIDMVGEKGKGPIIMQTVNGENNIISIMMDKLTNKEFNLSGGGSSDDLSFIWGKYL